MDLDKLAKFVDLIDAEDEPERLKLRIAELRGDCLEIAKQVEGKKVIVNGFEFSVVADRSYKYSEEVSQLEGELKKLKERERVNEIATLAKDEEKLTKKRLQGEPVII